MMTLQSWRALVPAKEQQYYMQSTLWRRYKEEWVWELAVVDPEMLLSLHQELTEPQQAILKELLNGLLLFPVAENELLASLIKRLGLPSLQCKQALQLFAESGIILAFQEPWQGLMWWMPLPILHNWRNTLAENEPHPDRQPVTVLLNCHYEHEVPLAIRFMFFLHHMQYVSLRFTKKGQLNKAAEKHLQRGQDVLGSSESIERAWNRVFQGSGGMVTFLLELAYNLSIIDIEKDGIVFNKDKLYDWLSLTQQRQQDLLRQCLLQLLLSSRVISPDCLLMLIDVKAPEPSESWRKFPAAKESIENTLILLEFWADCGYLSYSYHEHEETVSVRGAREIESSYSLHVEDNGELLLMPGIMPHLLWYSLAVSEVVSVQEVIVLRLTIKSLQAHVMRGCSVDRIRSWLVGHTNGQLSQLVEQLLQAAATPQSYSVEANARLVTFDQESDAELRSREADPCFFEMRPLLHWGRTCMNPLGKLQEADLLSVQNIQRHFQVDELAEVTRSWQQELRDYHMSTKRQLIETAIRLGLALVITTKQKNITIVPFLLEEDDNGVPAVHALLYREPRDMPLRIQLSSIDALQLSIERGA